MKQELKEKIDNVLARAQAGDMTAETAIAEIVALGGNGQEAAEILHWEPDVEVEIESEQ